MAKVSRELLKDLVKECLVEILSEGLSADGGSGPVNSLVESSSKPQRKKARSPSPPANRRPADLVSYGSPKVTDEKIESRITAAAGGNSIMESILRDTAKNTLPTMLAADNKQSMGMAQRVARGDQATKVMAGTDPMDIFEGASNWATLAFAGDQKN